MKKYFLAYSWSYVNQKYIVKLLDTENGLTYEHNGLNAMGVVFTSWLKNKFADLLTPEAFENYYLSGVEIKNGKVHINGAIGIEHMLLIPTILGITVTAVRKKSSEITGFYVEHA